MRGRLVFINPATQTGLIFGLDRNRYTFAIADWEARALPNRNDEIDFQPRGTRALRLQPAGDRDPNEPYPDVEQDQEPVGAEETDPEIRITPPFARSSADSPPDDRPAAPFPAPPPQVIKEFRQHFVQSSPVAASAADPLMANALDHEPAAEAISSGEFFPELTGDGLLRDMEPAAEGRGGAGAGGPAADRQASFCARRRAARAAGVEILPGGVAADGTDHPCRPDRHQVPLTRFEPA